jgi:hypothetical protein
MRALPLCLLAAGLLTACGSSSPAGSGGDAAGDDDGGRKDAWTGGFYDAANDAPYDAPSLFGDASVDASSDAPCQLGSAGSFATQSSLNLFGQTVYYADGGALPAGHYRSLTSTAA